MSHRKALFDLAALEGDDGIRLEGKPSFLVAIDCGHVARLLERVSGRRAAPTDQAEVFVFAVDGADSPILLFKSDGEEFAFGGSDQIADFLFHFVFMV